MQSGFFSEGVDGRFFRLHAAPGRSGRLRVHADDVMPGRYDFAKGGDGKVWRPHEHDAQNHWIGVSL
jgi:hypothetical protein